MATLHGMERRGVVRPSRRGHSGPGRGRAVATDSGFGRGEVVSVEHTPEKTPRNVFAALQGSGFPFQTAVRHAIGAKAGAGWRVHASEYSWQTLDGEGRFLDLVADNGTFFLTIECKKTTKDTLIFLRPLGLAHTGQTEDVRCLRAEQIPDSTKRLALYCENWRLEPSSTVSEFCVVSTSKTGDQRMLERDAGEVVLASDAFAEDFRQRFEPDLDAAPSAFRLFVPVIVTNAPLVTARYNPTEVSLADGRFKTPPREIESCHAVRFQKTFRSESRFDLGERTVFVVHAPSFPEFLDLLALTRRQSDDNDRARVRFVRGERQQRND